MDDWSSSILMLFKTYFSRWHALTGARRARTSRSVVVASFWLLVVLLGYGLLRNLVGVRAEYPAILNTVFSDTANPAFTIATVGSDDSISYSVTSFSGATIFKGQAQAQGKQVYLTLPRLEDDYYVLHVTEQNAGSTSSQNISFAVISAFNKVAGASTPFGVGVHLLGTHNAALVQLIAGLGAGMVRDDAVWATVEKAPGSYNFSSFDPAMQMLQQNSLDPLLILDYNNRFYDNGQTPYDAAGLAAFANYAKALVTHYGQQVKEVEVYNEYNGTFSTGPCARKPACYAQLLRSTYQAVKSVRPDVMVIGGAVFSTDTSWFRQLFADGALAYMDAVSDHPYAPFDLVSPEVQGLEEEMQELQGLIRQYNHGVAKPVWITEIGWPSCLLHVSERAQADYLVRGTILSQAAGVQKILWYDAVNDGSDSTKMEQNFGLLRQRDALGRYTPKPDFVAYAVLIRELANRSFLGRESVFPGIYDMRYSGNLRVFWSTLLNQSVTLSTNAPVTAISMTGRMQTLVPSHGRIVLNVTPDPMYVLGNISGVSWHM